MLCFQSIEDKYSLQMVLLKTLNKRNQLMSVATKIGIQISAKLGGEIWSVPIPVRHDCSSCFIDDRFFSRSLFSVEKFDDHWY